MCVCMGGMGRFIPSVPPLKSPMILVGLSSSKMLLQSVDLFVRTVALHVRPTQQFFTHTGSQY